MSRRSARHLVLSLTICLLCAACGDDDEGATMPRFESAACDFTLPPGQDAQNVTCGHLTVPENHQQPTDRTIRIAAARFKATGPHPVSDALVYLDGGPGGPTLEYLQYFFSRFAPFQTDRDLVFFDQRGIGRSQPALDCPEWRDAFATYLTVAQSIDADSAVLKAALRACHDRLVRDGVNLAAYTSAQSALDVHDLMIALGYQQWNVYGISYGTRLAQTVMRDAPQGVRSVGLDSTVPVQANLTANFAADFQRSLYTLFDGCAKDAGCNAQYPNLQQTFFDLVSRLNAEPVTLRPTNPTTGMPFNVVVNGDRLLLGIQQALYSNDLIPLLPIVITTAARGSYRLLTEAAAGIAVPSPIAWAMFYSVECGEEAPFVTPEIIAAATAGVQDDIKRVGLAFSTQLTLDICAFWGANPPAASENQPVVSTIPTLVFAGEYDPITRPDYGRLVAQSLSRSSFFEFPGFGHGILSAGCPTDIVTAFLSDPTQPPDASCIASIPPPVFFGT